MARISEQSIEKVRNAADIIEVVSKYVELKQRGRNFFGLCPFHTEKTPSFSVNPEKQIYKCFGCGAGGGSINFVMDIENLEFADAIKHLAQSFNIVLDIQGGDTKKFSDLKTQLLAIHELSTNFYQENLASNHGEKAMVYLKERGLTDKIIEKFKIGFSIDSFDDLLQVLRKESFSAEAMKLSGLFIKSEKGYFNRFRSRIMFPIQNYKGNIIAFGGRIFNKDDPAKYQNSPETPIYNKSNTLYGIYQNNQNIRENKKVILVEGYMDLLQLTQAGINNCLAISGTAFTEGHAILLKRYTPNIYICFDGDDAGKKASLRAGYILASNSLEPRIITPPNGMDPDDWVRDKGKKNFDIGMQESNNIIKSHYKYFSTQKEEGSLSINNFIQDSLEELINIKDPIILELMIKEIANLTSIDEKNILHVYNEKIIKRKRFKKIDNNVKDEEENIIESRYPLKLYDDIIRLCFSSDTKIREFIFNNLEQNWIQSDLYKAIYEKLYIHLKGIDTPPINIIAEQFNNKKIRQKFIDLTFDLNKFETNYIMVVDCIIRLEQSFIKNQIDLLREKLKNDDDEDIITQLSNLEQKVQNIKNKYSE